MKKNKNLRIVNTILLVTALLLWIASAAQAQVTTYTNESDYLTALTSLGYNTFQEGFEDDATWGGVRTPTTAASITSMGIKWTSNHPDAVSQPSHITTGGGPARTGNWGFYASPHGDPDASGSEAECDVETPPPTCIKHDGFMGTNTPGADTLFGVGGWINGISGGDIIVILNGDEANPVDFGDSGVITVAHKFFGVIDTRGFTQFEFRETEGKIGDEKFIFADDFTFGTGILVFEDVPPGYWAEEFIYKIYEAGITSGCSQNPLLYCPEDPVTRAEMAVFLVRGIHGSDFIPPPASGIFGDVPVDYWAADWIEQFYNDGITAGCSQDPLLYCPEDLVTRAEMAVFLLRSKHGSDYTPPAATWIFDDVPVDYWAADWIEQLYTEGITSGCSQNPLLYCPDSSVTRAQMAVFIVRTFDL